MQITRLNSWQFWIKLDFLNESLEIKSLKFLKVTLSTRSLVIPSCQGDSIIFHNENFLQLKGVLLTHPPLSWSKERAHTTYSRNCNPWISLSLFCRDFVSFLHFNLVRALIAVPWASPWACKHACPQLKGKKEKKSLQKKRGGRFSG